MSRMVYTNTGNDDDDDDWITMRLRGTAPQQHSEETTGVLAPDLFHAVANRDYNQLLHLYSQQAYATVHSYHTMKQQAQSRRRYPSSPEFPSTISTAEDWYRRCVAGEWNNATTETEPSPSSTTTTNPQTMEAPWNRYGWYSPRSQNDNEDQDSEQEESSFCQLLSALADLMMMHSQDKTTDETPLELSLEAEHLLRDTAASVTATRPPNTFVVPAAAPPNDQEPPPPPHPQTRSRSSPREASTTTTTYPPQAAQSPQFDGSVANATPPPLGGTSAASGGAGTLLHLACAMDIPLALAFLLAMGGDARASHTAFRRLMIHEAACNGSLQCLTLLLELGQQFQEQDSSSPSSAHDITAQLRANLPFLPRRVDRSTARQSLPLYAARPELFWRAYEPHKRQKKMSSSQDSDKLNFVSLLRLFRTVSRQVQENTLTELDAARQIMKHATLSRQSQVSLARSCGFRHTDRTTTTPYRTRSSISDGHGNTPLHWAAFKNETACVSLLLQFQADPNARAHPSGWTPLHDAAYSNAKETIALLLNAGACVDARANSGATPLCFAAQENASNAAQLLLARGAQLSARCAGHRDALHLEQPSHNSRFSGYTPLHYCAHYNAQDAARVLLQHCSAKRAMEIPDLSDRLPVHVAVARGSSNVLRELLRAGVRIETRLSEPLDSERAHPGRGSPPRPETPPPRQPQQRQGSVVRSVSSASQTSSQGNHSQNSTPVSSPILRSMIPQQPITSSKPWNCLTQRSIDECRALIGQAESHWSPERHDLFTPSDRRSVVALLLTGKQLEQRDGVFVDLWPEVLSFCGRGWFEPCDDDDDEKDQDNDSLLDDTTMEEDLLYVSVDDNEDDDDQHDDGLSLPTL